MDLIARLQHRGRDDRLKECCIYLAYPTHFGNKGAGIYRR
jgi:hypothetical protein